MKPIISVVVPFYNAEQHLKESVENILSSTKLSMEIILVDDDSRDSSSEIARNLQSRYSNVRLFKLEKNSGAGIARNTAIPHCLGEFVLFFDADDDICPGALEKLVSLANNHSADLVVAAYDVSRSRPARDRYMPAHDQKIFEGVLKDSHSKIITSSERSDIIQTFNYPWNKLFRTTFLKENQIVFGATRVQNDVLAHWMGVALSKKTCVTREKICTHYIIDNGSITTIFDQRRFEIYRSLEEVKVFIEARADSKNLQIPFAKFSLRLLYWVSLNMDPRHMSEWIALTDKELLNLNLKQFTGFSSVFTLGPEWYVYSMKLISPDALLTRFVFSGVSLFKKLKGGV